MDATSPFHVDGNGNPLEWNFANLFADLMHAEHEGSLPISDYLLAVNRTQIQSAFNTIFGDF